MDGKRSALGWLLLSTSIACSPRGAVEQNLGKDRGSLNLIQESKLNALDPWHGDAFGNAVSISGERALVGCTGDDRIGPSNEGAAYVFELSGGTWTQRAKLTAWGAATEDRLGNAVALWEGTALVAASARDQGANVDQGAVYVFIDAGASWTPSQTLVADDGVANEAFGRAIALEGDTAVVGADGSARVFERSDGGFSQTQKISPPAGADNATFGRTVALSGDTLLVGASGSTIGANAEQGAVYVYQRSDEDFVLAQTLVASDGVDLDHFGSAIALSEDTVAVGVDSTKPASDGLGAAYLFGRSGGSFVQQARLTAPDATEQDHFGRAVAVVENFVVVGAPLHEHGGRNANHGSAYVFRGGASQWADPIEIFPYDAQNNDYFGSVIALDVGVALIGSPNDDVPFTANGSAYVYRFEGFLGEACTTAAECQSGFCSDGVCCSEACSGACDACTFAAGAQQDGFCAAVAAGSPGEPACSLACDGVLRDCPAATPCATDNDCTFSEYCRAGGSCAPRKALGSACSTSGGADCLEPGCRVCSGGACVNGTCSPGVCATNVHCDANPCLHGGACTDTPSGHACACPPGVNGLDCEVVFTQLSGGHYDMCGLRSDGKIACWGQRSIDVPIEAPAGTFKWVSLSQHLCAVRTDGTALCQGYGATMPPPFTFKSVYAGDMRACGIRTDDTAVCWGQNPLGAGDAPPGAFRTLALGQEHTCGIHTDGTVECWGLNPPLGFDDGEADPPGGRFTALAASGSETCGIAEGGNIICWGSPSGLGAIPALLPWKMLGNRFSYGCALRSDGLLYCIETSIVPGGRGALPTGPLGRYETFAVSGAGFACGVRIDDAVICWGNETVTAPPTGSL